MTAHLSAPARPAVDPADLSYESTVPRGIVHRHAVSEVFLTDSARVSDTRFLVAAHLPTTHAFFGDQPRPGRADPLYFVETSRQACVLLAHRYHGVPRGYGFVFRSSTMTVLDADALRLGAEPAAVVLTVDVPDVQHRNGIAYQMELSVEAAVNGRPAIRFTGVQLMLPRETFAQLRATGMAQSDPGRQDGPPVAPHTVGRTSPRNVVLSAVDGGEHELIVDQSHPVFFDHPQDHAPGLLLVEAFRQAAFAVAPGELASMDLTFDRFVELGTTVRVLAEATGDGAAVRLVQGGQTVASATVRVA